MKKSCPYAKRVIDQLLAEAGEVVPHQQLVVRVGRKVAPVASFADASARWMRLRDDQGLASSESPRVEVLDADTGKVVAHVAYNGRVFSVPGNQEIEVPHITPIAKTDWDQYKVPPRKPYPDELPPTDV